MLWTSIWQLYHWLNDEHSEERYEAQAMQMVASLDWIVESYEARSHLLIERALRLVTQRLFRKLRDLFEKMLVELDREIGFADSLDDIPPLVGRGRPRRWRADNPPRFCPHPVTTLVDRLARSNLNDIPPIVGRGHAQLSRALYDRKRDVLCAKFGKR